MNVGMTRCDGLEGMDEENIGEFGRGVNEWDGVGLLIFRKEHLYSYFIFILFYFILFYFVWK